MSPEDAEQYTKWLNDPSTSDGLGNTSSVMTVTNEKEWLEKKTATDYQFAIIKAEDDTLLGNCGINEIDKTNRTCIVGLFIGEEENRSKGYGAEALTLLLNYCFNTLDLENVMLSVFSFNDRAIVAYKKVGFKEIGHRRSARFSNGKRYDEVFMDILKEEFNAIYKK